MSDSLSVTKQITTKAQTQIYHHLSHCTKRGVDWYWISLYE